MTKGKTDVIRYIVPRSALVDLAMFRFGGPRITKSLLTRAEQELKDKGAMAVTGDELVILEEVK